MTSVISPVINDSSSSGGSSPILAAYADNTRTQATYSPAGQAVVAMTSDLDVVMTVPTGATKGVIEWDIFGETSSGNIGFIAYRDVDGGGFVKMPNSSDGNYYSVINTPTFDSNSGTTASNTHVRILDESLTAVGSVCTYRIYIQNTHTSSAASFELNEVINASGSTAEDGLSSCEGVYQ